MLKILSVIFVVLLSCSVFADEVPEQQQEATDTQTVKVQLTPDNSVQMQTQTVPQQLPAPEQNVVAEQPASNNQVSSASDSSPAEVHPEQPDAQKQEEPVTETEAERAKRQQSEFTPEVDALLKRNPFGTPEGIMSAMAVAEENNGGFQLRSVYCVDKKWYFGIYEIAAKKFYTLKMGERHSEDVPYIVDFYDDETQSVSFSTPLGVYTLTLKERDPLTGRPSHVAAPSKTKNSNVRVRTSRARR